MTWRLVGLPLLAGGAALLALSLVPLVALRRDATARAARGSPWPARVAGVAAGAGAYASGWLLLHTAGLASEADVARAPPVEMLSALVVAGLCARLGQLLHWRASARGAFAGLSLVVLGYVAHAALVSFPALVARPHSLHSLLLSLMLLVAETASLALVVLHGFYAIDALGRRAWPRDASAARRVPGYQPKVAVQVTVFNEPPAMVCETLDRLAKLDYPRDRLIVMVLDDSTDEAARARVAAHARRLGFQVVQREDRRGFKAGALNHANALLPSDVELTAVVDADFQVEPGWLRETVGYFGDREVAFVQTPQAYRNEDESALTRHYAAQDAFFYRSVMRSRNESNSIIFCGTMGIVRLSALRAVGGWSETHICEDAELSLRLLEAGGKALYVPVVYGRGLAPSTFSAYKRQQFRWAFGNVRIAITRARLLLRGRLDARQRADYLLGLLHWADGAAILAIAGSLGVMALAYAFGWNVVSHHRGELWLAAMLPLALLVETTLRLHAATARTGGGGFSQTLGMFALWSSLKLNNARAVVQALSGAEAAFERTPKTRERAPSLAARLRAALSETRAEARAAAFLWLACLACLARVVSSAPPRGEALDVLALCAWLGLYATMLSTAPAFAFAALAPERAMEPPVTMRAPAPAPVPPLTGRRARRRAQAR